MAIMDKLYQFTTTVLADLGVLRPGPGQPIRLWWVGATPGGTVVITTGPTLGSESACGTWVAGADGSVAFDLPTNVEQIIIPTFADGELNMVLDAQTNL